MRDIIRVNWPVLLLVAVAPLLTLAADQLDPYVFRIVVYCGINVILAVSLNLINGITGQFSLGHAGFMAVGAYVSASVTYFAGNSWFNPWLSASGLFDPLPSVATGLFFLVALLAGGTASAVLGLLVGLPSLRLRGDYLAIVTLGFGEIIGVVIRNIEVIGGSRGFADIAGYTSFTWVVVCVVLTIVGVSRLVSSAHGRALLAVREDEVAAESVGISTTRYKVLAFVISAFLGGIAGGLFAHFLQYLNPSSFTFVKSFELIAMVVLGGLGSISGSIVASIILTILPEGLRPLQNYTGIDFRMVIYSLVLVVMMLTRPHGLFGRREIWPLRGWKLRSS